MDEKEELVKKALFSFVRKQVPTAQLRYLDPFRLRSPTAMAMAINRRILCVLA